MAAKWSKDMACWTYTCIYGCFDFDFEGEGEAALAFERHDCPRGK